MFTVKHIQHGIENLYVAKGVTYRSGAPGVGVELLMDDGHRHMFEGSPRPHAQAGIGDQVIFVMNEFGKTIARYDLGSPEPL